MSTHIFSKENKKNTNILYPKKKKNIIINPVFKKHKIVESIFITM